MARPLRIEFPGALYHVMSRGNERRRIVRDDADRQKWIEWLRGTVKTCGWRERRQPRGTPPWTQPRPIEPHRERIFTDAYSLFTA